MVNEQENKGENDRIFGKEFNARPGNSMQAQMMDHSSKVTAWVVHSQATQFVTDNQWNLSIPNKYSSTKKLRRKKRRTEGRT